VSERPRGQPIEWYWVPIERQVLAALCRKSDFLGALQTIGFLSILVFTGSIAYYSSGHWPWYVTVVLLFLHGTCWAFLSNAFHEFSHGTVFATPFLNRFFLYLVSFLSWNNPLLFWSSHTEHHKFTLHPADDLEVSVYARPTLREFLKFAVVNPQGLVRTLGGTVRYAFGRIEGEWEERLFPESNTKLRRRLSRLAWMLLAGQLAIVAVAVYFRLWMLPVLITLAPFYGRAIQWLCNESQHTGLPGNVSDFRLCSRTIYLNPVLQFLYWHMNYHTDHHIYAAVPCYRLGRLHRVIQSDMPYCQRGLVAVWREINATLQRQKRDPDYQFMASVPPRRTRSAARPVA
jgi:fatty acid desaturase